MKKRLAYKVLIPLITIFLLVSFAVVWQISGMIKENITSQSQIEEEKSTEGVLSQLDMANSLVMKHVTYGMNVLKREGLKNGAPKISGEATVGGKVVPNLEIAGELQANNFDLVDNVKSLVEGTATIFVKSGGEFVRISTNVIKDDGSRAIGTILNPEGRAYKSILNFEPYYGIVNILGSPYLTGYEPMYNINNELIGIWYTGYKLSSLELVQEAVMTTKILDNGFIAVVNENGQVLFHSNSAESGEVQNVISSFESGAGLDWRIRKTEFPEWDYNIYTAYPESDITSVVSSAQFNFIVVSLIVFAILISSIVFMMYKVIINPIKVLDNAAEKVTKGNFDINVDVNSKDELGKLASSFNTMVKEIKSSMWEVERKNKEVQQAADEAKELQKVAQDKEQYLSQNTKLILTEMEKFADGDLTVKVTPPNENDEVGKLFIGFNRAVKGINQMMLKVSKAVEETTTSSGQISSSAEQMAAGAQEQSAQTSEVASAIEEMTKTIHEAASNASVANESSREASQHARTGRENIDKSKNVITEISKLTQKTAEKISSLSSKSDEIGAIIKVIDEIADQTNLLALNAAIEAARAGEEGRGFAVVADEVRKLAERTSKATKEIEETITQIQTEAKDADASMSATKEAVTLGEQSTVEVETSLQKILESAEQVLTQIDQLASSSEQQSSTAEEISKNIEAINSVTEQSASGIEQVARASEELNNLTLNLKDLIRGFKTDSEDFDNTNKRTEFEYNLSA